MALKIPSKKHYDSIIKKLQEECGSGITHMEDNEVVKGVPTGHEDLDAVLTRGALGFYKGGILELFGPESSGKTSLALRTVGVAQKLGMKCAWIDAESGFDINLAKLNGVDPNDLLAPELADTSAFENEDNDSSLSLFSAGKVLEIMYKIICSNVVDVIVLDSVAGLMPEKTLAEDFDADKGQISPLAQIMPRVLNKISMACKKTETLAIFINQLRDQPGAWFQNKFHTPGGRALKFFAHQRVSVEKINGEDGKIFSPEKELMGHYARVTIVKNKKAPPVVDTTLQIPIYYKEYFPDDAKKCYDLARKLQVIKIRNSILTWKDLSGNVVTSQEGESNILKFIRDNKLENRLAYDCVATNNQSEKNKDIKIPNSISELASRYTPNHSMPVDGANVEKDTKKKKKVADEAEEI